MTSWLGGMSGLGSGGARGRSTPLPHARVPSDRSYPGTRHLATLMAHDFNPYVFCLFFFLNKPNPFKTICQQTRKEAGSSGQSPALKLHGPGVAPGAVSMHCLTLSAPF